MSKADCEAALAQPTYVEGLQNALAAELAKVIRAEFDAEYSTGSAKFRPSMRCGSLIMEAVVGPSFASQLQEHYSSGDNVLELEVEGKPVSFVPQPTTTTTSTPSGTTKAKTTTRNLRTTTSSA